MQKDLLTHIIATIIIAIPVTASAFTKIDRQALVDRNAPVVTSVDTLSSLSVGNGNFAFTVDATGLQTFPEAYSRGVPLGTQSVWGWHSFPDNDNYSIEETFKTFDFGKGHKEVYACQFKEPGRQKDAAEWFRKNPQRLHLGTIGFDFSGKVNAGGITAIRQKLDMWRGVITSRFSAAGHPYRVETVCSPDSDIVAARIYSRARTPLVFRFAYPTGAHADDACNWQADSLHNTLLMDCSPGTAVLKRVIDATTYYVTITWQGPASFERKGRNAFRLSPASDSLSFTCTFSQSPVQQTRTTFPAILRRSATRWKDFWTEGAAVDFSHCTDPRARELERRVVLSQYLLAIQSAGSMPPQETGLTYNSWFGKFHLEMIWWHQAWLALWNHTSLLTRTLDWYPGVENAARSIARRQGYDGVRWMKMTDPSGTESPSNVGSFLIWQQPHLIYLAELAYRACPSDAIIRRYNRLVQETAAFMYSFATFDSIRNRYVLKGFIPAQETLKAATTVNAPLELSYWHFAIETAQKWRERSGMGRNAAWDRMTALLSPLAAIADTFQQGSGADSLYLAAETAADSYTNIRMFSDHMAVLGAAGMLPFVPRMMNRNIMRHTLEWVWNHWNWDKTWGWDYPLTAMNAARMGEPDKAVAALLMDKRTNTYLNNGHNYQDARLRIYLPGNGGLLTAIALMCAGWDGSQTPNPGFPKDGTWDVRWEGLNPLP